MRFAALAGPLAILTVAGGCKAAPASSGAAERSAVLASGTESAFCDGVPPMALKGRVTDAAKILGAEDETRLSDRLALYEQRTKHQMVVATTPSLNGARIDNFGTCLGLRWGIGGKKQDDGIVILIAPKEREMRIATGVGMESILTDDEALEIVKQMTPHFKNLDYAGGLSTGIDAIAAQTGDPQ
ncbi:TPM domain-containing protein [Sphingopyxis sp.]|uniref:TPM domain-containing protein n=1 Tax=Sphingopyxis sp. TaxID=1908224 RepID=UPI002FC79E47